MGTGFSPISSWGPQRRGCSIGSACRSCSFAPSKGRAFGCPRRTGGGSHLARADHPVEAAWLLPPGLHAQISLGSAWTQPGHDRRRYRPITSTGEPCSRVRGTAPSAAPVVVMSRRRYEDGGPLRSNPRCAPVLVRAFTSFAMPSRRRRTPVADPCSAVLGCP